MAKLLHNNCDNYPSIWGEWSERPSKDELKMLLRDYYNEETSEEIAEGLLAYGEFSVSDSECTQFSFV